MPIRSNEKRFKLNQQCRRALAANIFAPEKVRLQPRPEDGYAWSVTSANAALLKASLSSGNIHLYRSIYKEVGHSVKAVSPHTLGNSQSNTDGIPKE
ncbi:hypothetical protein N7489_004944, partial [Penicillium chrysogenum]|uniref:uncharacterized protein n=1 Tax=Penicillium chrysogenum TaxID=5076 RepID=UPI0024DF2B31